jgi:hypothetical protein
MKQGFLTKTIGGRRIEHIPCPHPSIPVDTDAPAVGVMHTIEGSLGSGLSVFQHHFAPHFALDGRRIVQMIPLGMIGCACENRPGGVETNHVARAQVEVAGKSQQSPWLPDAPTTAALADLMATLDQVAEIPLKRPFADKMPPTPWAVVSFSRRKAGKWGKTAGWFGHVEVPENAHWDPGALQWSKLLTRARKIAGENGQGASARRQARSAKPPTPIPAWFWVWLSWRLGEGKFEQFGAHDLKHRPELPFGGKGQEPIPPWAWRKAAAFTAARRGPHP